MRTKDAVEIAGATDPGRVRANNEDHFAVEPELGLMLVADGMGGHNSGEVASALAAQVIVESSRRVLKAWTPPPTRDGLGLSLRGRQLDFCVRAANTIIYEKGMAYPKDAGMGTTVVAVLMDATSLTVAHVGDSRLYLWRRGQITQLTDDHSLVGEQLKLGHITPAEAATSSFQNILTRALGAESDVEVDVADHPLMPGDLVLLATDGLSKMLSDADIARAIEADDAAPQAVVDTLVTQARAAGGVDNVTVVAARIPNNR